MRTKLAVSGWACLLLAALAPAGSDTRAETWLARQKAAVPVFEYELLARAQATLLANIARPGDYTDKDTVGGRSRKDAGKPFPWAPLRGIYPSPFKYRGVWSWDGPFHALAIARWDPELAREQIEILLKFQLPDGAVPDVIMEDGEVVKDFGKPPVLPWVCRWLDEIAPDPKFLAAVYPKLKAYEGHWREDRGGRADGLFHYGGRNPKFESGWDTSVRWDHGCDNLWAVDLNCNMVLLYESMASMAGRLNLAEDRALWRTRAKELGGRINGTLWDEQAGAYMDRDRLSGKFSGVLSPASFMPLYAKIADQKRAERLAGLASDPKKFFPGLPSVSYDDPAYRSSEYWRGPSWLNVDYFALKGLENYGFDRVAGEIRGTILKWCARNRDYLWEYYDSRSGQGLGAPQYGWTGTFVIELILDWNKPKQAAGIRPAAPNERS